jgi:hypothetical protein
MDRQTLHQAVTDALAKQPVTDLHTHVFAPSFGHSADGTGQGLMLWGIDELVTYHYLIAEVFRVVPASELPYDKFWAMSKAEQADHIWQHLFVERTPISEAARGVLTTLKNLGLDPNEKTLEPYRKWFAQFNASDYIDHVMRLANVDCITMTNEVFDDHEHQLWLDNPQIADDSRFEAVLRIDMLLNDWPQAAQKLERWGYDVGRTLTEHTLGEVRRFLSEWIDRMGAIYVATSFGPAFKYPDPDHPQVSTLIEYALMPVLEEKGLPWALMIGAERGANPALKSAGDINGQADLQSLVNLCSGYPNNRFLVTLLSRENQHELCVIARKFGNLLPFGCWWFLNNPTLIDEITRMRLELLGTTFAPQHSDARILDQLIYKWDHSRQLIANVLTDKYADAIDAGFQLTEAHIQDDVRRLMRDNFREFCGLSTRAGAGAG